MGKEEGANFFIKYWRSWVLKRWESLKGENIMIKCISLWEPWASLMMMGFKRNETRSWPTKHRGPLMIHAAKKWGKEQKAIIQAWPFSNHFSVDENFETTRGCLLGAVNVVNVIRSEKWDVETAADIFEEDYGDYSPGRFVWITEGARKLITPVPFKGMQGMFNIPKDLADFKFESKSLFPSQRNTIQ